MKIYSKEGWLDIPKIAAIGRANAINFYILIGSRQIGKTFGVCKYCIDTGEPFIYLRRTLSELEFVASDPEENPFSKIAATTGSSLYKLALDRGSKYSFDINRPIVENDVETVENVGFSTALTVVAKIRGFNGSRYRRICYDEFVPERHVARINNEFAALANMYETVNSNRELEGQPAVELWMLANANNLESPIIDGFGLTSKIEQMQQRGQEFAMLPDRGIMIVLAMDSPISQRKRKTALYKALPDSDFTQMALENKFSYNDFSNIQSFDLREFTPKCSIGDYTVMIHKNGDRCYIINKALPAPAAFPDSDIGWTQFRLFFPALYFYYLDGDLFFQNYSVKNKFLTTLKY